MTEPFFVYILTNAQHTVLYVGMTNDLLRRMQEHRSGRVPGFTRRYNVTKLVHYEELPTAWDAIVAGRGARTHRPYCDRVLRSNPLPALSPLAITTSPENTNLPNEIPRARSRKHESAERNPHRTDRSLPRARARVSR